MTPESECILILAPSRRDALIARDELQAGGLEPRVCSSLNQLCAEIEAGAGAALIAEDLLDDGGLVQLGNTLARQPSWSDFPLLILAGVRKRNAPERRLIRLGNVTLLDRPLRVRTMCRAAHAALRGRRRQYAAAREIDERDRFLAMLGHELRNPLSAIGLAVEVAGARVGGASRELDVIKKQSKHLARLVDDLLDVARVTAGKIVLQREPVEMGALVQRIVRAVKPRFDRAGVELTVRGEGEVLVLGDEVRLEQVATNLLTNALKYTPKGGRAAVAISADKSEIAISVKDTGVGIKPEMLERLFEPFVQDDDTLARSQGGMGVGLTLVKTLVELHGGSVSARSGGRGLGSEFEIRLPRLQSATVEVCDDTASSDSVLALSIVLIDDHTDNLELLAESLGHSGHRVTIADTGLGGIEAITEVQPDAAIVDIGLPDIDGFEVARRVRASIGKGIRLIALSGYGQPSDTARSSEAGFDLHLTKPASLERVLSALQPR